MIRLVKDFFSIRQILSILGFCFLLTSCSFNDQPRLLYIFSLLQNVVTSETQFSVGGTVTGLTGSGLVLQNNGSDNLSVPLDGSFTFASLLKQNEPYSVTVSTQPTSPVQTCSVTNGSGTITSSNISDIVVSCVGSTLTLTYIGSPYTYTVNTPIVNTPTVTGSITSCSVSPSLPAGLSLDVTTCAISGTPSVAQAATVYTITASNTTTSVITTISILINSDPPSGLTYTGSPYTYTLNTPIPTKTPSFVGTVSSCSVSPALPTGLSISATTCAISGTPTVTQAATNYTITASNSFGSTTATISITVNATPPTSLVYTGSPYSYTQNSAITINTPSFIGTATSCSANPTLPTGLSIDNLTCAISGTPTVSQAATNYTITATNPFGNTTATISIAINTTSLPPSSLVYTGSPYTYTQNALISTNTPTVTGTITSCSASPALPTGLSLNPTTCAISGTPTSLQAATNYTITATNPFGNTTATISIAVNTTSLPPSSLVYTGSPYTYTQNALISTNTPTVTGTVTSCSASPTLPAGLSLNATTCAISGSATVLQTATDHTITASNAFGSTTATINITVRIPAPGFLTYTGSPYVYTQNVAITTNTPTVSGTVTSCNVSPTLPTGLSLNATTCAISGTPTSLQAATDHTITASNSTGSTNTTINIAVLIPAPSSLTYTGSPYTYYQNIAISTNTPTVTGTVTSCSASPTLPAGLSINATTCAISGTPTATQAATSYTITATNSTGSTTASINIGVNAPVAPSALTYAAAYVFGLNIAITTITPTFSGGPLSSCTSSPALPAGLSINNSTCVISGTPTATQAATSYTITASNGLGDTTASFTIRVSAAVRRIFITASTFTGDLKGSSANGTAGADVLCASDANKPATGTYKAFIVEGGTRTADPILDWVLAASTEYIRASDTLSIGTTNGSRVFTFGTLTNSFAAGAQKQYWTGFDSIGNIWKVNSTCNDWKVGTSGQSGVYAESDQTNYDSIYKSSTNCNNPKHLLCVEQ